MAIHLGGVRHPHGLPTLALTFHCVNRFFIGSGRGRRQPVLFATQILNGVVRISSKGDADRDIPTEFVLGVRRRLGELDPAAADLMKIAAMLCASAARSTPRSASR